MASSLSIPTSWRHHPRLLLITTTSLLSLAAPLLISHILRSYRGFLALGPGGLPYNFFGWCIQALAQPFARHDTRDARPRLWGGADAHDSRLTRLFAPHGRTSFLPPLLSFQSIVDNDNDDENNHNNNNNNNHGLPIRRGPRPLVPSYVAPQRQLTDHSSAAHVHAMQRHLAALANQQPDRLALLPSALESPEYSALWLSSALERPAYLARSTRGEIAHVHPDGSSHLVLSLVDAQLAIAAGWAETHMLSGVFGFLPRSYVLVYAPRDDAELRVWQRLLAASVAFTTAAATKSD